MKIKASLYARILAALTLATVIGIAAALYVNDNSTPVMDDEAQQQSMAAAMRNLVSGEFSLVDHTGQAATDESYRGEWLLVFFGYTHCPDVCPTTLGTIALVLDTLGENAATLRPLFFTVDPARDTPEVLAKYAAAFHPRITGLTGTAEQVAAAAKSHGVFFAKAPPGEGGEQHAHDYAMDHAVRLYLMDPDGVYAAKFSPADSVETIVAGIRKSMGR